MTMYFVERLQFVLVPTIEIAEMTSGIVGEGEDSRWSSLLVVSRVIVVVDRETAW